MNWGDVPEIAVGAFLGGLISWLITWWYSRQGSEELRREAEDVRHYVNALISYLEGAGVIRVVRDDNDRPIETKIIRISGISGGEGGMSVGLSVGDQEQVPPDVPSESEQADEDR